MYEFVYTQPDGTEKVYRSHNREQAMTDAQRAFFMDYKQGKWEGKNYNNRVMEREQQESLEPVESPEELSGYEKFMRDVCNDDEQADVDGMYEKTNDEMDAMSEDMNPVSPMQPIFGMTQSNDDDNTEENVANATTSHLEIAMSEDPQVREDTPIFQGGWGSGANGVSNYSQNRTVNTGEVSKVAVERQEKHDTWLAELGLSRPTKNISITKAGYKRGTAVVDVGYDNLKAARTVWDEKPDAYTAASQFIGLIQSEDRQSVDVPLHNLRMRDDGIIQGLGEYGELGIEENALRQLLAATRFGAGVDMVSAGSLFPRGFHTMKSLDPDVRAYVFNEHMKRHCSTDKVMRFRTRKNGSHRSIFGVVGTGYQEYDADKVANMIQLAVDDMPYKADIQYNSETTNFTMDLTMHAPDDLVDFSAGDLYEVGFRFKANDRGGGSINGNAIAFWNECLNMIILHSKNKEIMRAIHKGNMQQKMEAIQKGMQDARPAMERFAQDWGILGQTASLSQVSSKDMDDYGFDGANGSHILIKKLVAEGKVASGIGRDAAVQMMFDSYADQGGGDSVQDVINAITRMAHQNLVDDCARDVLEREAGALVPVLARNAGSIAGTLGYLN